MDPRNFLLWATALILLSFPPGETMAIDELDFDFPDSSTKSSTTKSTQFSSNPESYSTTITKQGLKVNDEWKSLPDQYIERNNRIINSFISDLEINKFQVALSSIKKIQSLADPLQSQLSELLGGTCSQSLWDENYINEVCTATLESVETKIIEFEEMFERNRKYRVESGKFNADYKRQLVGLHQNYSEILQSTLGNYSGDSSHVFTRKSDLNLESGRQNQNFSTLTSNFNVQSPNMTLESTTRSSSTTDSSSLSTSKSGPTKKPISKVTTQVPVQIEVETTTEILGKHQDSNSNNDSSLQLKLSEKFHTIDMDSTSFDEKVRGIQDLLKEVKGKGLNNNSEIFQLASLIRHSSQNTSIHSVIVEGIPIMVQGIIWPPSGDQIKWNYLNSQKETLSLGISSKYKLKGYGGDMDVRNGKWSFPSVLDVDEERSWFFIQNEYKNYYLKINKSREIHNDSLNKKELGDFQITLISDGSNNSSADSLEFHWTISLMCKDDSLQTSECSDNHQFVTFVNRKYPAAALDMTDDGVVFVTGAGDPGRFQILFPY